MSSSRSSARPAPKARRARRSYHHGALRDALLSAAEALLEADGVTTVGLRAVARAAGVSHAAPAHHFGDLTGLLSELAATGYQRLSERFGAAMAAAGDEARVRRLAMGRAYVGFAREHPGLFALMFRSERLDMDRPALRDAVLAANDALRGVAGTAGRRSPSSDAVARATALWSLVHGFAVLLLDNRLRGLLAAWPGEANPDALLDAVLETTRLVAP